MSDIRKRLKDILNGNFTGSNEIYLNTEITSYSSKQMKSSPNYIATSPSRFNLSSEFDNLKKRESLKNKLGKLKDFSKDMEYYINSSGNISESKAPPVRAQFSATLNALERSLRSPRNSLNSERTYNTTTQTLNSYNINNMSSERSSTYVRPLVFSTNDFSLTKTKIKREIDSLTHIFNKENKPYAKLNKPMVSLNNKPEFDLSSRDYFNHSPTMTKKKYLVTAFSSNLKNNKNDVITLKSLNLKKNTNTKDKKQIVARNFDNNDVENFTKEFDFKRKQSLFEKFSQKKSVFNA